MGPTEGTQLMLSGPFLDAPLPSAREDHRTWVRHLLIVDPIFARDHRQLQKVLARLQVLNSDEPRSISKGKGRFSRERSTS